MTLRQKAQKIKEMLAAQYAVPAVPLIHHDAFTLLCAVVLSARCTDARVNTVTPVLFKRARTPAQMAALTPEELRPIIRPCGLSPSKSKALVGLSRILVEKYGGKVPQTFEDLESLPGVGHKTASVVLSQAFGKNAFPVDTHIFRLARRWGLSKGNSVAAVERDLKALYAPEDWYALHLQMIYWGREFCRAHNCKTPETFCPICRLCRKK